MKQFFNTIVALFETLLNIIFSMIALAIGCILYILGICFNIVVLFLLTSWLWAPVAILIILIWKLLN